MPVFRHSPARAYEHHHELVAELARHLDPAPGVELPPQPEIYEEDISGTRPLLQVTVIWGAWENFSESERIRIILEAYERARGRDAMLRVSVAVGLTTREAKELGFAPHSASQSN